MRPSWEEVWLKVAKTVAQRATCPRAHVGAVFVRDNQILTTGYNGAPSGWAHCSEVGCLIRDGHCRRTIHAEKNAILQAAREGISLKGTRAHITSLPCRDCYMAMSRVGVEMIVVAPKSSAFYPQLINTCDTTYGEDEDIFGDGTVKSV